MTITSKRTNMIYLEKALVTEEPSESQPVQDTIVTKKSNPFVNDNELQKNNFIYIC